MAVSPTFPGVYVQEVPSGVRTIVGVGTSITVFIGEAKQGPMNRPSLCLSYSDFARSFSEDATVGDLPYYVRLFFLNGGTQCYVVRTANNPAASSVTLRDELNANDVLVLTAKDPGRAGDNVRAVVTYGSPQPESMFNIDLFRWDVQNGARVKTDLESWKNLSMNPASPVFAATFLTQNSKLVDAAVAAGAPAPVAGFSQSGRPVRHDGTDAVFQNVDRTDRQRRRHAAQSLSTERRRQPVRRDQPEPADPQRRRAADRGHPGRRRPAARNRESRQRAIRRGGTERRECQRDVRGGARGAACAACR